MNSAASRSETRPGWEQLGRRLLDTGTMTAGWAPVFAALPRGLFLPDLMWPHDPASGKAFAVDKGAEEGSWYGWAESDVPIVTQWDDGTHPGPGPGTVPTSSASMPSVVLGMLRDLDVADGMTALEIGTGTGWNAGLLAYRLGGRNVTSMEVDPAVAGAARGALARNGLDPGVECADGLRGWPGGAPYDRIIVTCGLRDIPLEWVRQARPGGVILAPWGTHFSHQDALARLVVAPDGRSASGRFTGPVQFMKARSQRLARPRHEEYAAESRTAATSTTDLTADDVRGGGFDPAEFAVGLQLRDCAHAVAAQGADGALAVWLYGLGDRSWAVVEFPVGGAPVVQQFGPRRLWDEYEAAHAWWRARGRPGFDRLGLTVTPDGCRAWLDEPGQAVPVVSRVNTSGNNCSGSVNHTVPQAE